MNLFEESSRWLEANRTRYLSSLVCYVRGQESVQLDATIGQSMFQVMNDVGVVINVISKDFLFFADQLVLGGKQVEPQPGDLIVWTHQGTERTYRVLSPGSEPCFRFSDAFGKVYRVHTKMMG